MSRPVTTKTINPSNGYLCRVLLEQWDAFTNTFPPMTGATITATFARDAAGTLPITGMQNIALAELGGAAPGVYASVISGPVCAALIPYIGQTIYQIVSDGVSGDLLANTPLVVKFPRYAT